MYFPVVQSFATLLLVFLAYCAGNTPAGCRSVYIDVKTVLYESLVAVVVKIAACYCFRFVVRAQNQYLRHRAWEGREYRVEWLFSEFLCYEAFDVRNTFHFAHFFRFE